MEEFKPDMTAPDFTGLDDFLELYRSALPELAQAQQEMLRRLPPGVIPEGFDPLEQARVGLAELEAAIGGRDLTDYLAARRARVAGMAGMGVDYRTIADALVTITGQLEERVATAFPDQPKRAMGALRALHWLQTEMLLISGEVYGQTRESKVEDEFQEVIRRLSTPVIQVWDEIVVMPLVGVLDSSRARQMMEQLLERIVSLKARIVILDVTGVPTVDTAVAEHLIRTTKAARLVGARSLLVGITPQVAQTLVRLGVSLAKVETYSDLRSGLQHAFGSLGLQVSPTKG